MLLHTRGEAHGLWMRRQHAGDRPHLAPGLAADRLPRAAQQGDRRAQRLRPRVGDPPGRRAQGAHDLRDHGRHDGRARGQLDRARQALGPPRAAPGARGARLPGRRRGAQHSVRALQGDRRQEEEVSAMDLEALVTDELREAAVTGWTVEWFDVEASTRRPPHATVGVRSPDGEELTGAFTGDGPIDAIFRAINAATGVEAKLREFRVDAVTGGQDALGETSVVVELDGVTGAGQASRPTSSTPPPAPTCARSRRRCAGPRPSAPRPSRPRRRRRRPRPAGRGRGRTSGEGHPSDQESASASPCRWPAASASATGSLLM